MIEYYSLLYSYFHELYLGKAYQLRNSKGNQVLWDKLIDYCRDNNQDIIFILYKCFTYHLYKTRRLKNKKTLNLSLAISYLPHTKSEYIDNQFVVTPFLRGIMSIKSYIPTDNEIELLTTKECLKFKNIRLSGNKEVLRQQAIKLFNTNYNYITLFKNMLLINGIDRYNIFLILQPSIISWLDTLKNKEYNKLEIIFNKYNASLELDYCTKLSNLIKKGNDK